VAVLTEEATAKLTEL